MGSSPGFGREPIIEEQALGLGRLHKQKQNTKPPLCATNERKVYTRADTSVRMALFKAALSSAVCGEPSHTLVPFKANSNTHNTLCSV